MPEPADPRRTASGLTQETRAALCITSARCSALPIGFQAAAQAAPERVRPAPHAQQAYRRGVRNPLLGQAPGNDWSPREDLDLKSAHRLEGVARTWRLSLPGNSNHHQPGIGRTLGGRRLSHAEALPAVKGKW